MTERVVFIGLGNMGGPMAINLFKAGFSVVASDLSPAAREKVAEAGVSVTDNIKPHVAEADVLISMLPASVHVERLYLGDEGLLKVLRPGTRIIDCSTIAPAVARKVAEQAQAMGLSMVDAPVSGGTAGAAAASLTFMVGGDAAQVEQARPLLAAMGKNIFHAGGHGAGQAAKVCNNMLLAIHMIGTAEALNLGQSLGLDARVLSDIMKQSSGDNWSLQKYNPVPGVMEAVPASRGYAGGFGSDLMLKDLGLAIESGLSTGVALPLGSAARQLYALHHAAGDGALDFSSIIELLGRPS